MALVRGLDAAYDGDLEQVEKELLKCCRALGGGRRSAALALVVVAPDAAALDNAASVEARRYPGVAECVDGGPPGAACTHTECRYHLAHRGYWEHHLKPTRDCSLDVDEQRFRPECPVRVAARAARL